MYISRKIIKNKKFKSVNKYFIIFKQINMPIIYMDVFTK